MSGRFFNHMDVVCRGFDLSYRLEVPENGLLCCGASEGFQQLREILKAMWVVRQPEVVAAETSTRVINSFGIFRTCFVFLPPANEVWGKVMLLPASVILFTGGSAYRGSASGGSPPPRVTLNTMGYGQQAGSTHPTGMLSCWKCKYLYLCWLQKWTLEPKKFTSTWTFF